MEQNLSRITKIGNWIATLLLGNTRDLIARIDERTIHMQRDLDELKGDFKDMKSRMDTMSFRINDMSPKIEILWKNQAVPAHSRRSFNAYGRKVLKESGIKEIIDEKKGELLTAVRAKGATNVYDAEQNILSVVKNILGNSPDVVEKLKPGAFNTGADLDMVFLVGGIYLRDLILPDLGFMGQS